MTYVFFAFFCTSNPHTSCSMTTAEFKSIKACNVALAEAKKHIMYEPIDAKCIEVKP